MKNSIISLVIISVLAQFVFVFGLFILEKKYPDFDKNGYNLPVVGQDSPDFFVLSNNLRNNNNFSLDNKTPEVFRTPGYPLFLAVTGGGCVSLILSVAMTAVSVVLVYIIALYFLPQTYAFVAGGIYAISPSVIFHGSIFLSDGLFTFFILLSVYLYLYKRHYILIGIAIGCATLVRPIGVYLPFLALIVPPYEKKKLWLVVGFCIMIFPWMIRNHAPVISSITTYNMAYYNIPEYVKAKYGQERYDTYFSNLIKLEKQNNFRLLENQSILEEMVNRELKGNIVSYTVFHLGYIPKFLISSPIRYISINTGNVFNDFIGINKGKISILNADRVYMLGLTILALSSVFFLKKKKELLGILLLIAYFALLTGPVAIPRYRLPVDGFIIILALYSIYSIMPFICRKLRLKP